MQKLIKLNLKVSEAVEEQLLIYGRIMKHEIYRIAGVYKKRKKVFNFRYKYISNDVSWYCKSIVIEQAKQLYEREGKGIGKQLNFSSIWSEKSYEVLSSGILTLELGVNRHKEKIDIPFVASEQSLKLAQGTCKEMMIIQSEDRWLALIRIEVEDIIKGDLLSGLKLNRKEPILINCDE